MPTNLNIVILFFFDWSNWTAAYFLFGVIIELIWRSVTAQTAQWCYCAPTVSSVLTCKHFLSYKLLILLIWFHFSQPKLTFFIAHKFYFRHFCWIAKKLNLSFNPFDSLIVLLNFCLFEALCFWIILNLSIRFICGYII